MVIKKDVKSHFDKYASDYDELKKKNQYYYDSIKKLILDISGRFRFDSVLDIGCGTGEILNHLKPRKGVGVDISPEMVRIAKSKYDDYEFIASDFDSLEITEKFDLIIVIDVIEHLGDMERTLANIRKYSNKGTKIIVSSPSYYWKFILDIGEKLRMKMPEGDHKWIPPNALKRMIRNNGLMIEEFGYSLLVPKRVPILSDIMNTVFRKIPIIRNLGLVNYLVCSIAE